MNVDPSAEAGVSPTETTTEAVSLAGLVTWSASQPLWQRDALRRLCDKEALDQADFSELLAICKGASTTAVPLDATHVSAPGAAGADVILKAVRDVRHVNALAGDQVLSFGRKGLTVIYGDNGSGKSGYARILKQACRARGARNEKILPNIYSNARGPATARIEFLAGQQSCHAAWQHGTAADPLLSSVSIFDSNTANVHVEATNDLAYTPFPLKLLSSLAQACQALKERLNEEIAAIEKQTPASLATPPVKSDTAVGRLLSGLAATTKTTDVEKLATLSPLETARLAALKADLAADPARQARQLQQLKARLDAETARLEALITASSDEKLGELRAALTAYQTASAAARAASTSLFAADPLPEIGSAIWRTLWEAARGYSEQAAYPGIGFPNTTTGARCVLCQQDLAADAAERLNRFEAFVKNESKRREDLARETYEIARSAVADIKISSETALTLVALIRDEIGNDDLARRTRLGLTQMRWRHRAIVRCHQDHTALIPPSGAIPIAALREASAVLAARIAALLADNASEARKTLIAEHDELSARAWLATVKADVLAEIDRKKQISQLQKAARDTTTNRITAKSAEVAEALVTNALRGRFSQEVGKLGIAGSLAVELRPARTRQGVPLFKVCLTSKPDEAIGDVLSEGEHRCVALAAFMAELATTDSHSGIVFDDPVSSLDHVHREKVAERLVNEAVKRQVIVFTHDIAFLFLLDQERQKHAGLDFTARSITRGSELSGFCDMEGPPNARTLDAVIASLRKHLENTKVQYERGRTADWARTVSSFEDDLRKTWERAVEEAISPVYRRLSNRINTGGLIKVSVLTETDHELMRDGFKRCSELLHSSSAALNKPLPKPEVIEGEINVLEAWITSVRMRQAKHD